MAEGSAQHLNGIGAAITGLQRQCVHQKRFQSLTASGAVTAQAQAHTEDPHLPCLMCRAALHYSEGCHGRGESSVIGTVPVWTHRHLNKAGAAIIGTYRGKASKVMQYID